MSEKRKLLQSQKELLQIKFVNANQAQAAINMTIDRIAMELGIPKQELSQWKLDSKLEHFEKKASRKKVKEIPPGRKNKKEKK